MKGLGSFTGCRSTKRVEDIPESGEIYVHLGCLAKAKYPSIEYSAVKTLELLGFKPATSYEEVCCGGILYLSGFTSFKSLAAFTGWNTWLASKHSKHIASVCDTCYSTYLEVLKHIGESEIKGEVEEALAKVGVKPAWDVKIFQLAEIYYRVKDKILGLMKHSLNGVKIAVHHGCHYSKAYPEEVLGRPESVRFLEELVESLGGEPVEYAERNLCCGACFAISASYDRKASLKTTEAKLGSMIDGGAELILVTCPGCMATFDEAPLKVGLPVLHVAELVGLILGLDRLPSMVFEGRRRSFDLSKILMAAK